MRSSIAAVTLGLLCACPPTTAELRPEAVVLDTWAGNPRLPSGLSVQDVGFYGTSLMVSHARTSAGEIVNHPDPSCPQCPGSGSATEGNTEVFISRSDDDGTTWTSRPATVPWKYIDGLFSSSLRLYAIGTATSQGAGGGLYSYYEVKRLDPEKYTVIPDSDVDGPKLVSMLRSMGNSRFSGMGLVPDQRAGVTATVWPIDFNTYDPNQLRLVQTHLNVPVQGCRPSSFELMRTKYVGYCRAPPSVCQVQLTTAGAVTTRCTDEASWPEALRRTNGQNVLSRSALWVPFGTSASDPPASIAYLEDGEGAPRTWTLPGPVSLPPDALHSTYAGLFKLFDGRFVATRPGGAYELYTFLSSPCTNDASCGPSRVVWLSPLSDGRYLVFYALEQRDHLRLVVLAQTPTIEAVGDGGLVRAGPLSHPEAQPGSPLDRFCLLVQSCFGVGVEQCRLILNRGTVADLPNLQGYAEAATCDNVLALWPALARVGQACNLPANPEGRASGCVGDVSAICQDSLITAAYEECASGGTQVCAPQRPCAVSEPIGCGPHEPHCEGDSIVYACQTGSRFDCTFLGLRCVSDPFNGQGSCQPAVTTPVVCQGFGRQCDGPFMLFCQRDSLRYLDCRDVGKTSCVVRGSDAFCE